MIASGSNQKTEYRLRNHIPLSGPATREPFIGDEPFMRVSLGFTPKWYADRLGINFSENWHLDPVYRYESLTRMKEYLHSHFPSVSGFIPLYNEEGVEPSCATISGVFGIMLISSLYGIEIEYREDNWPDVKDSMKIPKEVLVDLEPFSEELLMEKPLIKSLFSQMDIIEKRWGQVHGYLNYQGILNVAMKVMGSEFFIEMLTDPGFVKKFLSHIAGTIELLSKMVQRRQRASGFEIDLLSMSNCVVSMISPEQYEEYGLPFDDKLSKEYERFGVHTCNWVIDPYIDVLRKIEKIGYIDTGMNSDLKRVRKVFPDARRAVLYTPGDVENKSVTDITKDMERLRREYAPCDVVLADIETTVSDARINEFIKIVDSMKDIYGDEDE